MTAEEPTINELIAQTLTTPKVIFQNTKQNNANGINRIIEA